MGARSLSLSVEPGPGARLDDSIHPVWMLHSGCCTPPNRNAQAWLSLLQRKELKIMKATSSTTRPLTVSYIPLVVVSSYLPGQLTRQGNDVATQRSLAAAKSELEPFEPRHCDGGLHGHSDHWQTLRSVPVWHRQPLNCRGSALSLDSGTHSGSSSTSTRLRLLRGRSEPEY
eukprot:2691487-Rhodomonas_salina.1